MKEKKEEKTGKKLFVIDTNVLAHDWRSVFKFQENDICITLPVIQELDDLKSRGGSVAYNSRNTFKFLDNCNKQNKKKNPIRKDLGDIFVSYIKNKKFLKDYKSANTITNTDDQIIMYAKYLSKINESKKVKEYDQIVLVTKDIAMREKAKVMDVIAEDYSYDSVQVNTLYTGMHEVQVPSKVIDDLYKKKINLKPKELEFISKGECNFNSCFILNSQESSSHSALACYQQDKNDKILTNELRLIKPRDKSKISIETINTGQKMAYHILTNPHVSLASLTGTAGSGKTLLAILAAIDQCVIGSTYKKIVAMRPLVSLSGKDIGYLPGDTNQKILPFMQPIYDNLDYIKARSNDPIREKIEQYIKDGRFMIEAMAHVRGRTFNNTILIVDEFQNATQMEAVTLISRMGKNSKIILTGDIHQIDSPYLNASSNGLSHVIDKFSKENPNLYGHISLEKGERSELATMAASIL